jgi:hypothetical protein
MLPAAPDGSVAAAALKTRNAQDRKMTAPKRQKEKEWRCCGYQWYTLRHLQEMSYHHVFSSHDRHGYLEVERHTS